MAQSSKITLKIFPEGHFKKRCPFLPFFFAIVIWSLQVVTFQVNGQSSAGVKFDVNMSRFYTSPSQSLTTSMKTGASAGFFYKLVFRENTAAVQADFLFRYRAAIMEQPTTTETANYRYFGIEMPLYYMIHTEIEKRRILDLGIGPFAAYGLQSRYKSDVRSVDPYKIDQISGNAMIHRWDYGVALIIYTELQNKLQFNFNYQVGLRNLLDKSFNGASMKSVLGSVGVGYRF